MFHCEKRQEGRRRSRRDRVTLDLGESYHTMSHIRDAVMSLFIRQGQGVNTIGCARGPQRTKNHNTTKSTVIFERTASATTVQ
jgi:hypothetical protein